MITPTKGGTFPPGVWQVEIQGFTRQFFEGGDIRPTEYGCFFVHPAVGEAKEMVSFYPWSQVLGISQGKGRLRRGDSESVE